MRLFLLAALQLHATSASLTAVTKIELLQLEQQQLRLTTSKLVSSFLQIEESFPAIKCEEFMEGALKECRDAHVECIQRAYATQEERKTARSIRRSSLDPMSLEDQLKQDEKNIQPQDMTPLQRKVNFATTNEISTIPFSDIKLGAKIKLTSNIKEIPNVKETEKMVEKEKETDNVDQMKFKGIHGAEDSSQHLLRSRRPWKIIGGRK